MADLKTLLDTLPIPPDEAAFLEALLPRINPEWGIRAMVLHSAASLLAENNDAEAAAAYNEFDARLPKVARFSFMPLAEFHLRFLRLATLLYPGEELELAMAQTAQRCMAIYLLQSRALRITQIGTDNQLGIYIQTATDMMHHFINCVSVKSERHDTHSVHLHFDNDPTSLVRYLAVPFYETLFKTFSVTGTAKIIPGQRRRQFTLDLSWSGEPPSLADLQKELMELMRKQKS